MQTNPVHRQLPPCEWIARPGNVLLCVGQFLSYLINCGTAMLHCAVRNFTVAPILLMQDKRANPRREITRPARIELGDGTTLDCALSDVSQNGARIALDNAAAVPEEFVLVLRDDLRRHCRAMRRADNSLGVMFIAEPRAAAG